MLFQNEPFVPDLAVTALHGPSIAQIGGQIFLSMTVANQGQGNAGPFLVEFYLSTDAVINTGDIDTGFNCTFGSGLASGVSSTCSGNINIPPSLTSGTYYLGAIADPTHQVSAETNMANNARTADTGPLALGFAQATSNLNGGGAVTSLTSGSTGTLHAGYAEVTVNSGNAPYGTAVFSLTQDGVVTSEAGVPASPPTTRARFFIDFQSGASAKSADEGSVGNLNFDTGIAAVNPSTTTTANVTYLLRDANGSPVGTVGHGTLAPGAHFAKFIDQLSQVAPDFSLPANFSTVTQFGSLEVSSDMPISILALRMTAKPDGELLLTSTPIADMTQPPPSGTVYFPRIVDGGGWKSVYVLLNTSSSTETGNLNLFAKDGSNSLTVQQVNGPQGNSFSYSIPPNGIYLFTTDGSPTHTNEGSVQLIPDSGQVAPVGAGLFRFFPAGNLVTESGVPAATPTTHARIFVDQSGAHRTGLAIANPSGRPISVTLSAFQTDGTTPAGSGSGTISLSGNAEEADFVDNMISGLPPGFVGVLDISSPSPFAALELRALTNSRGDFLITTFPTADFTRTAPSPIIFPQIADGVGGGQYRTEIILLGTNGPANTTISYFGDDGSPLAVAKHSSR